MAGQQPFLAAYHVKQIQFCGALAYYIVMYLSLTAFSDLTLLIGWQEGHPAGKN